MKYAKFFDLVSILLFVIGLLIFGSSQAAAVTIADTPLTANSNSNKEINFLQDDCPHAITVQNANYGGEGSLRQATKDICEGGIITFDNDYTIYPGMVTIGKAMTIDGGTNTITLTGKHTSRIFNVTSGPVTLNHLTITDGDASSSYCDTRPNCGGGIYIKDNGVVITVSNSIISNNKPSHITSAAGGGIFNNEGTLIVLNSTFSGNTAYYGDYSYGGGIFNKEGTVTVKNSIFSGNVANYGGGIFNSEGTVLVQNSIFSDNLADFGSGFFNSCRNSDTMLMVQNSTFSNNLANSGGGIYLKFGSVTVQNSTFSGNSASMGGGIYNYSGVLHSSNTLIANSLSGGACMSGWGIIGTNDHNLFEGVGDAACGLSNGEGGSLIGVDPQLGELGDNGGMTPTFALQPGSPAIDAGNDATCLASDQRGFSRPVGAGCDIGAFESNAYLVMANTVGQGNITLNPESVYTYGSVVTATAVTNPGWTFANWQGDLSGSVNPQALTIGGNMVVTATFSNDPPMANSGANQTVLVSDEVAIDGRESYDEDPAQILTYGWVQTGGTSVALNSKTAVTPTFTAPSSHTVLTFTLTVTDSFGLASTPDEMVVAVQQPEIAIDMQANITTANVGDTITYTYTITNSGDVELKQVNAVDDHLGSLFAVPHTLFSGQIVSQSLAYNVVERDLPGPLVNTVLVSGLPSGGNPITDTATLSMPLTSQPDLQANLTASVLMARPGETITYTLTVTNSGDVTLRELHSIVNLPGEFDLPSSLVPGLSTSSSYSYTVLTADLPGPLTNTVTVMTVPPVGNGLSVEVETAVSLQPHLIFLPLCTSLRPNEN